MQNLMIKIGSSLFLIFVLAIAHEARTQGNYLAQIPFDFTVGENAYPAGEYIIRVDGIYNTLLLAVENAATRKWKKMPMLTSGSRARRQDLAFVRPLRRALRFETIHFAGFRVERAALEAQRNDR